MFFTTPDDLVGLDFANGDCRNNSAVMGTVTFGWQGLPFGLGKKSSAVERRGAWSAVWVAATMMVIAVLV